MANGVYQMCQANGDKTDNESFCSCDLASASPACLNAPMSQLTKLTRQQLQRAIAIKQLIKSLQAELDSMNGNGNAPKVARRGRPPKYVAEVAALPILERTPKAKRKNATTKRSRENTATPAAKRKKKRAISPEHRAKLVASAKKRWAKIKADGKASL